MPTVPVSPTPASLLDRADSGIKLSDHAQFARLLDQLDVRRNELTSEQRWHLQYLRGWQAAYQGDYDRSRAILDEVLEKSDDDVLRFRASATLINILGDGRRYQEAFLRLSQMQDQLPQITDDAVRYQGLGEAAQLLISAGQYDLATSYADQMLAHIPPGESTCKAMYFKLHARYRSGTLGDTEDPMLRDGIAACTSSGQSVFANAMRADAAGVMLRMGRATEAQALLQRNYADALRDQYIPVSAQFEAMLALANWKLGDVPTAEKFARLAVASNSKSGVTEPLSMAYDVLYRIAEGRGDYRDALDYHEKFMAADKGYLDDISATALAYQIVSQQVQGKRQEVQALNKQNVILKLEQALDRKAVENSRLYITLLLTVIAFIVFWVYRLKRSQLRFMWLSRQDSLTGICNRKHFIEAAEGLLRHAEKAGKPVALLLIDLDHFKLVNDTHGHTVGDQVLKRAVDACIPLLGHRDLFGRLGGEEFAIILSDSNHAHALHRAEEVRAAIANARITDAPTDINISASLGVVTTEYSGYQFRQLLINADHALYKAKRDGRNRVVSGREDGATILPFAAGEKKVVLER
ncbi:MULTISPECIES: GGDEF domain-containing protein [Dyella]|nr:MULTISPECIES: GGDEF domain-containing protein [Dyella]